jgi:hypothetical protein
MIDVSKFQPEKADAIMQGNFLADREENGLIVQLYGIMTGWLTGFCALTHDFGSLDKKAK